MRGAIPPLPSTPSWRGAHLKHMDNFTLPLPYWFCYNEDFLAPRPTPKLHDHPLSSVRDCLYRIFAVTSHISSIRYQRIDHTLATRDTHNILV
jgi:hypothetical protein